MPRGSRTRARRDRDPGTPRALSRGLGVQGPGRTRRSRSLPRALSCGLAVDPGVHVAFFPPEVLADPVGL